MAIKDNIARYRKKAGLSQPALAKLCGWDSQSRISNYETEVRTPSIDDLKAIANALNISLYDLIEDETNLAKQERAQYGFSNKDKCPVISWVQAGKLCDTDFVLDYETAEEWRYCPVRHSDKTYVLIVDGESMLPDYPDRTEIFVDPMINAEHNDDVVASTPQGKATFKRLQITTEGKHLLALNPNWPNRIIEVPDGTTICGVVIYSGKKRR